MKQGILKGVLSFTALCAGGLFTTISARAEDSLPAGVTATAAPAPSAKVLAGVDIRPSWTTKKGAFSSENSFMGGYQFTDKLSASAVYNFQNNLYSPGQDPGLNLQTIDFSVRGKIGSVYTHAASGTTLSLEERLYLPLTEAARDKGMITAMRSYLKFSKTFGPVYKLTLMEVPIVHIYSRAGSITQTGIASANPFFENRVYLINDFQLTSKLSLSVPVYFHITWHRDFQQGATNNARAAYLLWTYPELSYAITDRFTVAAAYYSDNLVLGDLAGSDVSAGLEKGVFQISLQATL